MDKNGIVIGEGLENALRLAPKKCELGENMAMLYTSTTRKCIIINKETGKWREIVDDNGHLLMTDDEIDYDAMEKGCPHYSRPDKKMCYSDLNRWDGFKSGICALSWTVYPDGQYFADEDGFGMESNSEEEAYCIIDKDLNIIVPWQPFPNISKTLDEMRKMRMQGRNENYNSK